ncbi:transcriptional regulator [Streptomyces clavuligerus]|nr:XRE family transcriptional regulator [Streptomyces clavuligerus]QCS09040.1 transcriptional regulator [Streptomyces clavuligerus]
MEQKAAAENRFVGRSTLANALTRDKLPSEAVVVALVRGCGYGEETAEEWLAVRCRIAAAPCAAEAAAQAGHGPEPPPESPVPHGPPAPDGHRRTGDGRGRNRRPGGGAHGGLRGRPPAGSARVARSWLLIPLAALLVVAAVLWADRSAAPESPPRETPSPSAAAPERAAPPSTDPSPSLSRQPDLAEGSYELRTGKDGGHCLFEGPPPVSVSRRPGSLYVTDCDNGMTPLAVRPTHDGTGTYRILLPGLHGEPKHCVGVVDAGTDGGEEVTVERCGGHVLAKAEEFRLEAMDFDRQKFRIRAMHVRDEVGKAAPDLCLGTAAPGAEWAPLLQTECSQDSAHVFQFRRVAARDNY